MELTEPVALLRRAVRSLRRTPGFAALCVLTLAVGIGAATCIFSLVDAVLLRPLPYPRAERLVMVKEVLPKLDLNDASLSQGLFLYYSTRQRSFTKLAIYGGGEANLSSAGAVERVSTASATAAFFPVLGVAPLWGRALQAEDDRPGAPPVAVVSDRLWRQRLGANPHLAGLTVRLDGVTTQVVGVMPPEFTFPSRETDIWMPMRIDPAKALLGSLDHLGIGQLAPGVTRAAAEAELTRLGLRLDTELHDPVAAILVKGGLAAEVRPLRALIAGEIGATLWLLLGAVGFILAIACANVANLLIVRGEERQRELAIHTALGVPRSVLIGLVLAESAAIALAASAVGTLLAWGGVGLLGVLRPAALRGLPDAAIDARALAFTVGIALATSLLFGLAPAWRALHLRDLAGQLRGGGRALTAGRGRQRLRQTLVGLQLALAMVLLTGSALMLRSFRNQAEANPGFATAGAVSFDLALPDVTYPNDVSEAQFWERLLSRLATVPGVSAVSATSNLPLRGYSRSGHQFADQPRPESAPPVLLGIKLIGGDYLRAMGIPLLAGRALDQGDTDRRTGAALVSATLARRRWPDGSALGRRLTPGEVKPGMRWYTVVGIVGDTRERDLTGAGGDEVVYYPMLGVKAGDFGSGTMTLVVRSGSLPPSALLPGIRAAVAQAGPDLALANVKTLDAVVHESRSRVEFAALMVLIATLVAVLLGAVGLYGFVSYLVGQRTPEIGVRIALGATGGAIRWLVVRESLWTAAVAVLLGGVAAAALTGFLASVLVQVSPRDPLSFAAAPPLLALITLMASYLPAARAARVEPLLALRRLE